jgi:hypothetical protein
LFHTGDSCNVGFSDARAYAAQAPLAANLTPESELGFVERGTGFEPATSTLGKKQATISRLECDQPILPAA